MLTAQPITLMNTGLPLTVLGALAFILPRLILPRETRSHRVLTITLLASVLLTLLAAIAIFGYIQTQLGTDLAGAFATSPTGTLALLIRPALLSGIVWLPLLVLSGFNLGQRIEDLRGRDLMREPPKEETTQ